MVGVVVEAVTGADVAVFWKLEGTVLLRTDGDTLVPSLSLVVFGTVVSVASAFASGTGVGSSWTLSWCGSWAWSGS